MKNSCSRSLHASPSNHHCCLGDQTPVDCQGVSQVGTAMRVQLEGHGTARHGTARHGTARHGTARHGAPRQFEHRLAAAGHGGRCEAGSGGRTGGCRAECSCPQIPGERDPKVMAILGSHRHSGNNRMSGPDMSSREKKHSSVWPRRGKAARCTVREPAALVPCPARASSSGGLSAAQPGRGATLGAAGQATNSCRRPARRGIATGAGGGTGSSGSCEKASGAAGRGGGRSGGAEEEEAAGAARALPPGTAPLRRPPKAAGLRPPVRASVPRARPPEPPRHARAAGAAACPALPALALPVPPPALPARRSQRRRLGPGCGAPSLPRPLPPGHFPRLWKCPGPAVAPPLGVQGPAPEGSRPGLQALRSHWISCHKGCFTARVCSCA
ncbi:atherin-like [Passer domesticus]|uniref:atherin-like n=1 Tax=Passer domesticus TaxID=48849 RepID=UPI0030FE6D7F